MAQISEAVHCFKSFCLCSEGARYPFHLSKLRCVNDRVTEDCNARYARYDLFEDLQVFSAQFREIEKQSGNVSTWSRDTSYKSGLNRISLQIDTNDGDGPRRVFGSLEGPCAASENCIHFEASEFCC